MAINNCKGIIENHIDYHHSNAPLHGRKEVKSHFYGDSLHNNDRKTSLYYSHLLVSMFAKSELTSSAY